MSTTSEPRSARYWSWPGTALMAVGIAMMSSQSLTALLQSRLGEIWRYLFIGIGLLLSIWGLKEIIVGFWPRFRRRGYSFHMPREGILFLLITCVTLVGAIIGGSNTLMMVFCLLASLWIMNGKFTFVALQRMSVLRDQPPRVMAGEPCTVRITLKNRKSWLSVWLMIVEDLIVGRCTELKPHVVFVRIPRRGESRGHYQVVLPERGRYRLGPITLNTRFPLGLVERGVGVVSLAEILVYPRIGRLRPAWKRRLAQATELVSHVRPEVGPFNDEMHRVREYRIGDDPRMIHWPTTARLNELMVREFRESRDRDLLVIVDAWLPEQAEPGFEDDFERGLRFAATICHDHLRHSRESTLLVRLAGETLFDWRGDSGRNQVEQLLDAFSVLKPGRLFEPARLTQGLDGSDVRCRVIVVSTRKAQLCEACSLERENSKGLSAFAERELVGMSDRELAPIFEEA